VAPACQRKRTGERAAVSSGERFLAAGGSSDQSKFTDVLPRPNCTEATPFPQS
jgi:hypothetical protein